MDINDYRIIDNILVTYEKIKGVDGETLGYFVLFKKVADIEKADINRLKTAIRGIADKILSVGLSQDDPEEFHTGRKAIRNLVQIINETGDLFPYKKEDIDALKHLFKSCGKSQDLHITHVWLKEHGFDKEAGKIGVLQKELQEKAMIEGKEFFASGVMESIKNSLDKG